MAPDLVTNLAQLVLALEQQVHRRGGDRQALDGRKAQQYDSFRQRLDATGIAVVRRVRELQQHRDQ